MPRYNWFVCNEEAGVAVSGGTHMCKQVRTLGPQKGTEIGVNRFIIRNNNDEIFHSGSFS